MSDLAAAKASLPAGGGVYALPRLTIGVFLVDQPTHRLSIGSDKTLDRPLRRHEGWILPKGSEGLCRFDAPLDFLTVAVDDTLLTDAGLAAPEAIAPVVGALDPLLLHMTMHAEALTDGGTLYRETMARALAAHLVQTVQPARPATATIDDGRLRRAADYIHDNLGTDLSLAAMADVAAMSPHHFAHAFKTATGTSPLQYVIGARIDVARVLLKTTTLTVAAIAFRVGYGDVSRFGRHFKKRVGATPAQFRDA